MCSLSNASGNVVLVEKVVHECEEILLNLIRKLSVSNLRHVYNKPVAVVRSPLLKMNGTPWRTSTLRVLDVVQNDLPSWLVIRVENLSRRLTLSSISLLGLDKSFSLELLRFLDSPHDVVSTDNESASHVCPFYKNEWETPGPFYRPRGIKSAAPHLPDEDPYEPEPTRHSSQGDVQQEVEESIASHQAASSTSSYLASSGSSAIVTYMVPKYAFTPEFPLTSHW